MHIQHLCSSVFWGCGYTLPFLSGIDDVQDRLLFGPLGPDHSGCPPGNAVTDLAHVFRLWWNTVLSQFPCSTPVTPCPEPVSRRIFNSDERKPATKDDCTMRTPEWSVGHAHVESGGHL